MRSAALTAAALLLAASALAAHAPEDERDLARAAELRVAKLSASALEILEVVEARSAGRPETLAEAATQRGLLLTEMGRTADAFAAFDRVIAEAPGAPAAGFARLSRARLLAATGKPDEAEEAFRALQWSAPAVAAPALLERGALADAAGRRREAVEAYRDVGRSFPRSPEATQARAALDAACAKLMAAPAAATLVDETLVRGDCLLDRERYADAVALYRAALDRRVSPERRADLFLALGRAYDGQEQPGEAESAWRKAAKALPGSPQAADAMMGIVQIRLDRGRLPEAIRQLEKIVKEFPGTPVAPRSQYMIATCWEALRDRKKAEEAYRAVTALAPNSTWALEAQQNLMRLLERAP